MILLDLPPEKYDSQPVMTFTISGGQASRMRSVAATSGVAWDEMFEVGQTVYPLRQRVSGVISPGQDCFQLHMKGLTPVFIGTGSTPARAELDLKGQIHGIFQQLYGKRPFQMTEQERAAWTLLEQVIDVRRYSEETPVEGREIGVVLWFRNSKFGIGSHIKVRWLAGREELVPVGRASRELASLRPGCWFEAVVQREPVSDKLRRVLFAEKIDPVKPMKVSEAQAYWDAIPTIKDLPVSVNL